MEILEGPEVIQDQNRFTQLELDLFPEKNSWIWKDVDHIVEEVILERHRQLFKYGMQNHQNGTHSSWRQSLRIAREEIAISAELDEQTWAWILLKEVYSALSETEFTGNLRRELIQCAAVIFAWIEQLDGHPRWEPARQ